MFDVATFIEKIENQVDDINARGNIEIRLTVRFYDDLDGSGYPPCFSNYPTGVPEVFILDVILEDRSYDEEDWELTKAAITRESLDILADYYFYN